jgi:acetylornithine deacetylase/succinyl-diaminopimelate desuccinylase-like protein
VTDPCDGSGANVNFAPAMARSSDDTAIQAPSPVELLQSLLRFDTTNPPGAERACIEWIARRLDDAGIDYVIRGRTPERPNLVARLPGLGEAPPLLLYGHVDVVPTDGQAWTHPPFSATIENGFVWGRGTLDMKGAVAMMLSTIIRLAGDRVRPPGDLLLAVVSDEEAGGNEGAGFLVEKHPELFDGVRHALGELGGFTQHVSGRRFYPIMVAEKQFCRIRMSIRGEAGHGSIPVRGQAMARLGAILAHLDRHPLPVHVTPVAHQMITTMARHLPGAQGLVLRSLLRPSLTDRILPRLGTLGGNFFAILHNTATPTIIRAGAKENVIPAEATITLDGRILPGQSVDDFVRELRAVVREEVEIEAEPGPPSPAAPDMSQFDLLAGILREADPGAIPVPFLLPAVTDARHLTRLGIQTYGFTPMQLPPELPFTRLIHAADERIPVDALEFGARAMRQAVLRYR